MFPHADQLRKYRRVFIAAISVFVCCTFASGQSTIGSLPTVTQIVQRAEAEVTHYKEEFRNLIAKETKHFRIYDKNSSLKKQRVIVSNFFVYDLSITKGETTEFRNVLSVDGKPVANADERAVHVFERISRAGSTSGELDRIQKESLRFDEEIRIYGLTLFQAIALNPSIRDFVSFRVEGVATIGGTETFILKFEQIRQTSLIHAGNNSSGGGVLDYEFDSDGLKNLDPRIAGTLWIDARTFQIVREKRDLYINGSGLQGPILLTSNEFEFDLSPFGIRTPNRISHIEYRFRKKRPSMKAIEITFDYSAFTRLDVEVRPEKPATRPL